MNSHDRNIAASLRAWLRTNETVTGVVDFARNPDGRNSGESHFRTAPLVDSLALSGRVCILGVGNRQRGDDGAGPRLVDAKPPRAPGVWLDTGVTPENFLEPVVRTNPNTILIVDAVSFGGLPGECRLLDATELHSTAVSTHAGSLHILSEYLSVRTGASIRVLAIQPQQTGASEELSQPVEKSVVELAALLSDILTSSEVANGEESLECKCMVTPST